MEARRRRVAQESFESSFDITLEETLKALHQRRLEIVTLLRSLEAEQRGEVQSKSEVRGELRKKVKLELVDSGNDVNSTLESC